MRPLSTLPNLTVAQGKRVQILFVIFRYYEGGISSVYLWDLDDGGFAGVVLFKKGRLGQNAHELPGF